MNEEAHKLGGSLKRIRTEKGITQVQLSGQLGVNKSFISNLENGRTNPTLATITSLAKALKVPVAELFR